ncbi:MAG: allophanate hydrolase, partial [Bacteroidota bacterium]
MPKFEIKNAGLLTTVQDLGRRGLAYYAMPQSGVMDAQSARVALLLLRLPEHYPLLECTAVAPQLYFHDATELVVSGANFNWQLDGVPLSLNEVTPVSAGQLLKGQVSRTGLRGYIAINGLLKVEELYGSAATY